jgi:predicted permease
VDAFLLDLRSALRGLAARPGFSALAITTLALGIGVNTVTFSALNALLYKPFRFDGADRLGWIMARGQGNPHGQWSWVDYLELARANRTFEGIAAEGRMPLGRHDNGSAEQVWTLLVSANYFSVVHARPEIGRVFTRDDLSSGELPALVSSRFWAERLDGGTSVAGRTLTLNGQVVAVVGVLPDNFQGPGGLYSPDVWLPLERADVLGLRKRMSDSSDEWLSLVGRLAPGSTGAQGAADLQAIVRRLAEGSNVAARERSCTFAPVLEGHPELRGISRIAWIVLGIVGLVLLIACFNVASLLLARAADRQQEMSLRAALGANGRRILRQLITEGLVLATFSGAAALLLASWSANLLSVFSLPSPIPQRLHIGLDRRLVGFTVALVGLAGILPALLPAFHAVRTDLVRSLRMEPALGGRRSRARSIFVVAQIAGSTLFLAAALLFVRSFWNGASSNPGFETTHALAVELKPSDFGYDPARSRAFFDNLLSRVRALPGIRHATVADRVPFYVGFPKVTTLSADGADCATADCRTVFVYHVGDGHFAALGVRLEAGRDFSDADIKSGTTVIVSRSLAARLWPDRPAVGQWIREGREGRQFQVVGVAADIVHRSFSEQPSEYLYEPIRMDEYAERVTLLVRTDADPRLLLAAVREQVQALDPNIPPGAAETMDQRMEMPLWPARTAAGFFGICGSLALALATAGLFGVTYLTVSQRTREFGIRTALGASRGAVIGLVLREGLFLTVPGIVLGLASAFMAAKLMSHLLYGVSAADPVTYVATAALQATVALSACALPAHRATKVDPMFALRHD